MKCEEVGWARCVPSSRDSMSGTTPAPRCFRIGRTRCHARLPTSRHILPRPAPPRPCSALLSKAEEISPTSEVVQL